MQTNNGQIKVISAQLIAELEINPLTDHLSDDEYQEYRIGELEFFSLSAEIEVAVNGVIQQLRSGTVGGYQWFNNAGKQEKQVNKTSLQNELDDRWDEVAGIAKTLGIATPEKPAYPGLLI